MASALELTGQAGPEQVVCFLPLDLQVESFQDMVVEHTEMTQQQQLLPLALSRWTDQRDWAVVGKGRRELHLGKHSAFPGEEAQREEDHPHQQQAGASEQSPLVFPLEEAVPCFEF